MSDERKTTKNFAEYLRQKMQDDPELAEAIRRERELIRGVVEFDLAHRPVVDSTRTNT